MGDIRTVCWPRRWESLELEEDEISPKLKGERILRIPKDSEVEEASTLLNL